MSSSEGFSDDDFIVSSASSSPKAKRQKPSAKPTRKTPPASNGSGVNNSQNGTTRSSTANNVNVSDQYQKLSQLEHILKRPDTYIGSVEKHESEQWIYNKETESMERKVVSIVPGLFKIFDEILVNAADNKIRDPSMKNIEVTIKPEENLIEVKNDGKGIPVQIHDKEHIYIPELIFGNLLTSSNYNDDQKKVTGGRNGYGAKLCNIFSTEFIVETYDKSSGKLYTQRWSQNMGKTDKPIIKSMKKATEYTKVSFRPDLAKFNMTELDEDILGVLRRRVFDLCGSVRDISVKLNGEKLKIRNFKQYVEMYVKALEHKNDPVKTEDNSLLPPPSSSSPSQTIVYQTLNDRWEIAFAVSDSTFNQVSFVNSIATTSGGTHVNFIADQIVKKIEKEIKTKNKKAMIKPFQIKNNMFLFINCLVENPAFTSQTKEQLTTRASQFGGKKTEVPDDFIKKILRTGIVDAILDIAAMNADKALKKNDGSRKNRITGYPKLEDANKAGTKEGYKCTLILTEGDSASSLAVAGLAVVGRDYYGVYPLRGKMLNVREASADQIMKNAEIQAIKQIMGFQHKKNYTPENINSLRYGHIMIMTDQDHDGSHIKGLIINFLESSFPGLLKVPNFLLEFITPIVKVTITSGPEKRKVIPFYSMPEYEAWREQNTESFKQKYYKGLGTSLAEEMRQYFSQLDKHMKTFHALQDVDPGFIDLAFSKKKADDRKEWLRGFEPGVHLDPDLSIIPISDFINKELILFSMADNIRSIPSMLDGFKPSQRKILYGCYKRNLRSEIKVSQLAGYIGEHSAYHHGDQSLIQSIIGLAQDFVGSNNLNLLQPIGGFGSRAQGGKDASAARYIFTDLSKITRKIFHVDDNPLLNYLQDDEQTVEPEWYLPIVPMLLINGSEGIGTGWSTNIPPFNPVDIVANIRRLMDGQEMEEMTPWYRGWNGSITKISADKFRMEGNIEQIDDETIVITEIPAKTWTINMKEFLLNGIAGSEKQKSWIKDMEEQHGMDLKFVITLTKEEMKKSLQMGLKERFKLVTTINVGNMVAFDTAGKIKKYDNVNEIIEDYYYVRLDFYQRRKNHLAELLGNQLEKISSQARFVKMIIENELRVNNRKRIELIEELQKLNFPKFSKDGKPIWQQVDQEEITEAEIKVEEEEEEELDDENLLNKSVNIFASYDYLLGMPIWSLTRERYHKLLLQKAEKEDQLTELLKLSAKQIWNNDLEVFLEEWHAFLKEDLEKRASSFNKSGPAAKKKRVRRVKKENDENDPDFGAKKPKTVAKKVLNPKTKPKSTSLMGSLSDITSELDKNLEGFIDLT